jgi:glycosyltransferase involved in cell wall biosynthesis
MIGRCLETLLKLDYSRYEIIVVNDHSTDRTGEIINRLAKAHSQINVITNPKLPAGWLGKNNAIHQAARRARGELILFTDADILFAPGSLRAAVVLFKKKNLGLLALLPMFLCGSFWENAVLPVIYFLIGLQVNVRKINSLRYSDYVGTGNFNLVRKDIYRKVGGHTSIKAEVLDDFALAGIIKKSGNPIFLANGSRLLQVRIYRGLADLFRGYQKNASAMLENNISRIFGNIFFLGFVFLGWLVALVIGIFTSNFWLLGGSAFVWLLIVLIINNAKVFVSKRWWATIFFSWGALVIFFITVKSVWHSLVVKETIWRGRKFKA